MAWLVGAAALGRAVRGRVAPQPLGGLRRLAGAAPSLPEAVVAELEGAPAVQAREGGGSVRVGRRRDKACASLVRPHSSLPPPQNLTHTLFPIHQPIPTQVAVVPGAGRGLVARTPVAEGTLLLTSKPLAAAPLPAHGGAVCAQCLTPLAPPAVGRGARPPPPPPGAEVVAGRAFCGPPCVASARAAWLGVEEGAGGFIELVEACEATGERFPLVASRLASGALAATLGALAPAAAAAAARRDSAVAFLAFANVSPPPPEPWVATYEAWAAGAARWLKARDDGGGGRGGGPATARVRAAVPLAAWTAALARLHVNAFRVDATWPAPAFDTGLLASSDWLAAAAAAVAGGDGQAGTALYGLPSLVNHACVPSAEPAWPANNATLGLRALTDLEQGEAVTIRWPRGGAGRRREGGVGGWVAGGRRGWVGGGRGVWGGGRRRGPRPDPAGRQGCGAPPPRPPSLPVPRPPSYINADLPLHVRRAQLLSAYGFACRCSKCEDEV